jgi:hypothetical protein
MNHCGHQGNVASFLKQYWQFCEEHTQSSDIKLLAEWRGIPAKYLRKHKWCKDPNSDRYLAPVRNSKGGVVDLRNVRIGGKCISTKGVSANLLGWHALKSRPGADVFIAAGEWDGAALEWMFEKNEREAVVIIPPGEGTMKVSWAEALRGRRVWLCQDNDDAGLRAMARIGGCDGYPNEDSKLKDGKLRAYTKKINYIHWPKDYKPKGDINDWVLEKGVGKGSYAEFMSFFKEIHPKATKRLVVKKKEKETKATNGRRITFKDILAIYRKWNFSMSQDMQDGLRLILATVLTTPITEDTPVWLYVVGPPGSGKTALIMALKGSEHVIYRSELQPHTLVSGWNGTDPSLIPELDGMCLALKDFTEVLRMRPQDRDEVFNALRGSFDGTLDRSYGNGVVRHYESKFTVVAGVTHYIHGQTAKGSALGERFLKYEFRDSGKDADAKVLAAIEGMSNEQERNDEIMGIVGHFIDTNMGKIQRSALPEWFPRRLLALVKLISILRTGVERDYRRNVTFRPKEELGTRLAKQLTKLAWGLCLVDDRPKIDEEVWRLVARVGIDTATGFTKDVVEAMMARRNGKNMTLDEITQECALPKATLRDQLDDMLLLDIVKQYKGERDPDKTMGPSPYLWTVRLRIRELWKVVHGQ